MLYLSPSACLVPQRQGTARLSSILVWLPYVLVYIDYEVLPLRFARDLGHDGASMMTTSIQIWGCTMGLELVCAPVKVEDADLDWRI
jgi:hypothetical protein